MQLSMSPRSVTIPRTTNVFISPMSSALAMRRFPCLSGLPSLDRVYVVVTETGQPMLVTNTHAEAARQVAGKVHFVLRTRH